MGTIPRFNNELSRWRKSVWLRGGWVGGGGGGGGVYKSSGRPLLSQIISEHLVIVAQRGSKITFLPTLRTSNVPRAQPTESRTLLLDSFPECIGKLKEEGVGGGQKDPSSCPVERSSPHNYSSKKFACN